MTSVNHSTHLVTRARHKLARRIVLPAIAGLALIAAACGSTTASEGTTTTTTTTTLPIPVQIIGSTPVGPESSVGPIYRLPVIPVQNGFLTPTPVPSGELGPQGLVKMGFRQIGGGPDLVLIMGQHGTMTTWDPQFLQSLAGSYTVTIFDLPGVGYSQFNSSAQSINAYADDTAGLISALGLVQPVVLGWGMGGQVAMALAERHLGIASKLVLVDTGAGGKTAPSPTPQSETLLGSAFSTVAQFSQLFFPASAEVERTAWLGRIEQIPADDIVSNGVREQTAIAAAQRKDETLSGLLHTIKVPTLIISGSLDPVFPVANVPLLTSAIPHAKRTVIVGAGYASYAQDPKQFLFALSNFMKS